MIQKIFSVKELLETSHEQRNVFRSKDEPKTTYHAFTADGESAVHMYKADSNGGEIHSVKYPDHKSAKEAAKKIADGDVKERSKFNATKHNDDLMINHREAGVF